MDNVMNDFASFVSQFQDVQYQCPVCKKIFMDRDVVEKHLQSHKESDPDKELPPVMLLNSTTNDEELITSAENSKNSHPCPVCGKDFHVPARLARHFRSHTGEKPFTCEFCNKSFSIKENLNVHRRIHTKERPYKCSICSQAFEHSGKLHRHMRIHTGERPHRCEVCGKRFIQSGQLVIHTRTHTGEKPYVCAVCRKGFTCSKQLKVHSRTHTGEKPYVCEICGRAFGYSHVLKLHQVIHFQTKTYTCSLCGSSFNSMSSLQAHSKSHKSEISTIASNMPPLQENPGVGNRNSSLNVSTHNELLNVDNRIPLNVPPSNSQVLPDITPVNVSPQQELANKNNTTSSSRGLADKNNKKVQNLFSPMPPLTIDPALLAAVDVRIKDEEEASRSSSCTPPLCIDEDAPELLDSGDDLCDDPLNSSDCNIINQPTNFGQIASNNNPANSYTKVDSDSKKGGDNMRWNDFDLWGCI